MEDRLKKCKKVASAAHNQNDAKDNHADRASDEAVLHRRLPEHEHGEDHDADNYDQCPGASHRIRKSPWQPSKKTRLNHTLETHLNRHALGPALAAKPA